MYDLRIDTQAVKFLKKLDKTTQKGLVGALMELAECPFSDTSVKRMKGYTSTFRKRVGDFRIIFEVDKGDLIILVLKIGNRGDIYKK